LNLKTSLIVCISSLTMLMVSCLGESHLKAMQISPNGSYKAELTESDTGAVGGWISDIQVAQVNPSRWDRLRGHERATVFGVNLRSDHVTFLWKGNEELEITCRACDPS